MWRSISLAEGLLVLRGVAALAARLLSSCQQVPAVPSGPQLTATEPRVALTASSALAGWAMYTSRAGGFSLRYPSAWSVNERPVEGSWTEIEFRFRSLRLTFAFNGSESGLSPFTDVLVGVWEPRGAIVSAERDLPKHALVHQGRVKAVRYGDMNRLLSRENASLFITMYDAVTEECAEVFATECGYEQVDIPADVVAVADQIAASLRSESAHVPSSEQETYSGWGRYIVASHGFSFRYPRGWRIVEGRNYLALERGTLGLVIGYRQEGEDANICCRAGPPEGVVESVEAVECLGGELERALFTCENRVKLVRYGGGEIHVGDTLFSISAEDFAADYESASISKRVFDSMVWHQAYKTLGDT